MTRTPLYRSPLVLSLVAVIIPLSTAAAISNLADQSIKQFLAQDDEQPAYRALRRLQAENGSRKGWLEVVTEFSPATGFRYEVGAEGGSEYIRNNVLRAVLEAEQEVIARGEVGRSALAPENYVFAPNGIDTDGLANILLSPRRKERLLIAGTMFLRPHGGDLVRLQGRLAKSPSFWIKQVEVVRSYDRLDGVVVPVLLESTAKLRLFGSATLRMTYEYTHIAGHPLTAPRNQDVQVR